MMSRRNLFWSLTSGLLLGLPWSVSSLFFIIFIAWVPLLVLEGETGDHPNRYILFNYAFVSFLLWNILGSWWVTEAQWLGAVLIMLANSLVQALIFWLISRVRTSLNLPLLFPFLIIWMGYEHFHESWDLAWPWLNLGNALATAPRLIQWAEYTGIRGGTLWIILTNFAIFKMADTYRKRGLGSLFPMGVVTVLLVFIPALVSYQMFHNFREEGETVTVALIQPNLDPYTEKFVPERQAQHLEEFFRTADSILDGETSYLFGPETLIVQQIDERNPGASPYYRQLMDFQAKYAKLNCVVGVHSYQKVGEPVPPGSRFNQEEGFFYEAFNTALFLSPGAAPQFYHKTKLVPLFERMPFVQYLGFLGKYSLELGGYNGTYSLRQERHAFVSPDSSVGILPIICFESAFGSYCARNLPEAKGFICMITNDGWWKNTPGYLHHYNFSPLRAIECRRALVRVANNGISALIDAKGMVIARTSWWEKATLKGRIHLRQGRTFFARHGDYLGRISMFLGIIIIVWGEIGSCVRKRQRHSVRLGEDCIMHRKTIHDTSIGKTLMRRLALIIFRFTGWKPAGKRPDISQYVIIAAPHTSNWDFLYTLCLAFILEIKPFIMMKANWFCWPMGPVLRWFGAIPVDRSKSTDFVARAIQAFRAHPRMVLIVPPSGTRRKVMYWKTGFYHIAKGANVPIVLGYLDYRRKVGGIGPVVHPTGNLEADMKIIQSFYADITAKHPKQALSSPAAM